MIVVVGIFVTKQAAVVQLLAKLLKTSQLLKVGAGLHSGLRDQGEQ
jgi:hypothetical protein